MATNYGTLMAGDNVDVNGYPLPPSGIPTTKLPTSPGYVAPVGTLAVGQSADPYYQPGGYGGILGAWNDFVTNHPRPAYQAPTAGDLDPSLAIPRLPGVSAQQINYNPVQMGTAGKALTARATQQGASPWLQAQLSGQRLEEQNALNQAARGAASNAAEARSGLAMTGGLSSGARERLGASSARDAMFARQGVRLAGQQNRIGLNVSDEAQKMALLGQATSHEGDLSKFNADLGFRTQGANAANALDAAKYNTGNEYQRLGTNTANAMTIGQQRMAHDLGGWGIEMQGGAAALGAGAIAGSGGNGNGGILGSVLRPINDILYGRS